MKTPKYNWQELSDEYAAMCLENNQLTLKVFCEQKNIPYNTATKKIRASRQGAPIGSQRALKHGGYVEKMLSPFGEEMYQIVVNATLEDDLLILRATLIHTLDVLKNAQNYFNSLTSWDDKLKMLEPLLSIHASIDRKIQRIESFNMTIAKMKLESDLEEKRNMELERLALTIQKIKNDIEIQIATKGSGKLTSLEQIFSDIQAMESDGFVKCA
ncbi:TPA: hypothetical protein RQK94_003370 [Vibrio vulnificus]|uniref:hypothetical protein n=1 Tax=Vibrio vulnificus TaxID=672 RepID=UPI001A340401|nr:hypothetical protein [Vibrio vulnificus]HAS6272434.1 hypothetical protein [Vibrio vulnificus]HDY7428341.1 hypothetical protein [Vibrio vulnificus]HDY7680241.1 hypothetical protein [Vibrio vulnificus]HDY7754234.1 hypothetical protein [Vibrio vulnificus]